MVCGPMDVAFVIDDTGSMGSSLAKLQAGMASIISDIQIASGNNYRIAVVKFEDYVSVLVNFAPNNAAAATAAINSLTAFGGNNPPEASDEALNTAVNALPTPGRQQNIDFTPGWNPLASKIAILVTDDFPGGFNDLYTVGVDDVNANNVALSAASQGIRIGAIFVPTAGPFAAPIMQNYATVTGGLYWQTAPDGTGIVNGIRTMIAYCGNGTMPTPSVTTTRTPTFTATPGPQFRGHVIWQGRPTQPNALQQLPITLTLKLGTSEITYPPQTTDSSGYFTLSVAGLPDGTYGWRVKGPSGTSPITDTNSTPGFLANSGNVSLTGAALTSAEMGLMKAGDCNNDNVVSALDFNILKNAFGKSVGLPGYDNRADFTGDGAVSVLDFNLLKGNFGQGGSPPLGPGSP
jgi:hypothetical protein